MLNQKDSPKAGPSGSKTIFLVLVRLVLFNAVLVGLLFGSAGTLAWTRGWILLALLLFTFGTNMIVTVIRDPEIIRQRWKKRQGTKPFDKVFVLFYMAAVAAMPVTAALDAVRFGWSTMASWWIWPGVALHLLGDVPVLGALVSNPHLEPTVRIQEDRGHTVATTGPYRFVRHPMYVGIILMFSGWPLILGSWWMYAVTGFITVLFVVRTALEDRTLMEELDGYKAYARKTRYRLVPGIW